MRFVTYGFAIFVVSALSGCELLDTSGPEGYWRPRAMEDCVPVPVYDAGNDAGPRDAGSRMDARVVDASSDARAPSDAQSPSDARSASPDGASANDGASATPDAR
jgi:hypothetical protein